MKNLLLFIALLLAAIPVTAQSLNATRPDSLPVAQAAPDTATALHRLFVSKRRILRYVTPMTFLVTATAIITVASASQTGFIDTREAQAFGVGLIGGAVLSGEALSYVGWSRKKERQTLEDWQQHHLSAFYKRKLKPKYFH